MFAISEWLNFFSFCLTSVSESDTLSNTNKIDDKQERTEYTNTIAIGNISLYWFSGNAQAQCCRRLVTTYMCMGYGRSACSRAYWQFVVCADIVCRCTFIRFADTRAVRWQWFVHWWIHAFLLCIESTAHTTLIYNLFHLTFAIYQSFGLLYSQQIFGHINKTL